MDMVMYSSDLAEIFEKNSEHQHKGKKHKRTGSYETGVHGKATGHLHHLQRERAYTDPSHHRGTHGPHHRLRTTSESGIGEAASGGEREKTTAGVEGAEGGAPSGEKHHKHHHGLHLPHPHLPHVHLPHPHLPHMHLPHPHMPQCLQPMDGKSA
ncbi:Hypp4788 [Branchiostoma lanceolatum]|uniref:Hypp4788 protein n=1 Tax=Branchiostoma lanceolatum TaxID=7740 RepID=A0A8K0AD47_BRALA|nr:Hypp4788 [Branchiostoma lanceolatum]